MATTVDSTLGTGFNALGNNVLVLKKKSISSLQGLSALDFVQAIKVDKNCIVLGAALVTPTMEETATALTVDIGLAGDTIMDGVDLITGAAAGKLYSAAGTNGAAPFVPVAATVAAPETIDIKVATLTGVITELVADLYVVVAILE